MNAEKKSIHVLNGAGYMSNAELLLQCSFWEFRRRDDTQIDVDDGLIKKFDFYFSPFFRIEKISLSMSFHFHL